MIWHFNCFTLIAIFLLRHIRLPNSFFTFLFSFFFSFCFSFLFLANFFFSLGHLLSRKSCCWIHECFTLQSRIKKNTCTIVEELRTSGVVITFEFYEVLVSLVCIMEVLAVLRFYEIVTGCSGEESWYKRISHVFDRRQFVNIKMNFTFYC